MSNRLEDNEIIFTTITGSHAYGMNTEYSDLDTRGVAIRKDKSYYLGFMKHFEQEEDATKDHVVYDIRKSFGLMADANPNMLELLFVDEKFWTKNSNAWLKIIEHRDKFLSRNVRYRYVGYAYAQLKRIKTARNWLLNPPKNKPSRVDYGLPEQKLITTDDLGAFQWIMVHLLKDSVDLLNFSEETKNELFHANWIGLIQNKGLTDEVLQAAQKMTGASDSWMEAMRKEQAYSNAKKHWDSYQNWKDGRNKKRAELEEKFGYDTKHSAHLVRLLRMGKEILETGKVHVYRPDREELLAIRNGIWKYEEVEEYAKNMENSIIETSNKSILPNNPDRVFLDNLCVEVVESFLNVASNNISAS